MTDNPYQAPLERSVEMSPHAPQSRFTNLLTRIVLLFALAFFASLVIIALT